MSNHDQIEKMSLWKHQIDAVAMARNYIQAFVQNKITKSALVHMPTGSGKTGVISFLARCTPEVGCVLILTPRIALREQLTRDVKGRFFERLERKPDLAQIPKDVVEVDGPFEELKYGDIDQTVFISTIQKLISMEKNDHAEFERLVEQVSLLLFDEGHYEPALTWSQTIRQFQAPRVIFTATPFRNDLKFFDIDSNHIFSYTYHEAVQENFIRKVEVIQRPEYQKPEIFIDDVIQFYNQNMGSGLAENARVIIRCERRATIRQLAMVLDQRHLPYIALHENFSDHDERLRERKSVPDPQNEDAIFWIHQFKLLEGIDDSRFQLLAIYEPFQSARPLIQQIGRIIRNPLLDKNGIGFVLDHSGGLHAELWDGFLGYDQAIRKQDGLVSIFDDTVFEKLIQSQPGTIYIDGRFRSQLNLDSLNPSLELLFPQRVNLLEKTDQFEFEAFCSFISQEYEDDNRFVYQYPEDEATMIFVYIVFRHSLYLKSTSFIEPKLGVTVIHDLGNQIAFFDSLGYVPINHDTAGVGKALNTENMKKLFQNHPGAFLTQVSLKNTNLGSLSIRSRSLSAANMDETVSAFDDHAQVCTTARGYCIDDPEDDDSKIARRYVGFNRGRISQSSSTWLSLDEYIDWVHDIYAITRGPSNPLSTFRRYAPEEVVVDDPTPMHILLDLFEVEDQYATIGAGDVRGGEVLKIENKASVVKDNRFVIEANGTQCEIQIKYDQTKKKYWLESPDIDGRYTSTDPYDRKGLIDYLNREQSFRVIPRSENAIYVLGEFYKPIFKVGREFNPDEFDVSKILFPSETLGKIGEEKTPVLKDGSGWSKSSLFGIIDDLGKSAELGDYFGEPELLVCDDMGTEIADFILADSKTNRVVFIHAKANRNQSPYSASKLQDVCAQATKNINYVGMYNEETPPGLNSWDGAWQREREVVTRRIRKGGVDSIQAWSTIRQILRHPLADREVWLFLGQMLSKNLLEEHLARPRPTPEALQSAFLLHATMTNVASVGAKLRVFCYH